LSNEAARVLLLLLLWLLLFRADLVVVRDQVREQLSTMMVVIFLPVVGGAAAGTDAIAVKALEAAAFSLLPPDRSDMSLGGPVAEANEIFSSSNSTGPEEVTKTKLSVDIKSGLGNICLLTGTSGPNVIKHQNLSMKKDRCQTYKQIEVQSILTLIPSAFFFFKNQTKSCRNDNNACVQ
jgi:hypothetical protein